MKVDGLKLLCDECNEYMQSENRPDGMYFKCINGHTAKLSHEDYGNKINTRVLKPLIR